jgi:hypothetical protein
MPRMEFEPMIPVSKRAKTVHALDRAVTVIGRTKIWGRRNKRETVNFVLSHIPI